MSIRRPLGSMKNLLLKRWFLVALLGGMALAWFSPQSLRPITTYLDLRFAVATALFLIAAGLESRSLFGSLFRPLPALWAVFLSFTAVPALAWLAGGLLLEPDFRIGLLIIASVPCTLAAAVIWTRLAGGNEATALLVVLFTTASSWLATTAWLALTVGAAVSGDPASMMQHLVIVLIVPVGLGQLSRAIRPVARLLTRHHGVLSFISRLLILAIVLKAVVGASDQFSENPTSLDLFSIFTVVILCILIHLIALAGGFWSSRFLRFDRPNQIAVAFACSQKTLPVALDLFVTYFQKAYPLAILPLIFYHVGQLIVDTFIAEGLLERRWPDKAKSVEANSEMGA